MAGRRRTRSQDDDVSVAEADKNAIIETEADAKDEESKARYLKRIAKEDRENEKLYQKSDRYIEIVGKKVLEKFKNASGSLYTRYWFNAKRYQAEVDRMKIKGGYTFTEDGKEVFVPLKYIDGREFKGK